MHYTVHTAPYMVFSFVAAVKGMIEWCELLLCDRPMPQALTVAALIHVHTTAQLLLF
jgi:hypothetical protein